MSELASLKLAEQEQAKQVPLTPYGLPSLQSYATQPVNNSQPVNNLQSLNSGQHYLNAPYTDMAFNNAGFNPIQIDPSQVNLDLQNKFLRAGIRGNELDNKAKIDYQNSFMGKASPYVEGFANIAGGLASLAGIYTGFKELGMAEDQLDIAKEKWAVTKDEMNRIKGVRDKITLDYMA